MLLILSLGLHWAFLQTIAWTGMLITYSRDAGLTEAVSKTFDGQHPCRLCHAIEKGKAAEQQQKQSHNLPTVKLDSAILPPDLPVEARLAYGEPAAVLLDFISHQEPPPKPHPRHSCPAKLTLASGFTPA